MFCCHTNKDYNYLVMLVNQIILTYYLDGYIKACIHYALWRTMTALALLEDVANGRIQREQNFRDQQDPLANSDEWQMSPALERSTCRNQAVPVPLQVLTTLGFQPAHSRENWLTGQGYPSQPLAVSCQTC